MNYQDIYSIASFSKRHIIGLTKGDYSDFTPFYVLNFYGVPEDLDEEQAEEALFDCEKAVHLGSISGWLVLKEDIDRAGEDLSYIADAADADLEFAVSALMEDDGPFADDFLRNYFHIYEMNISDKNVIPEIIDNLPDMIFTHCHVYPDIISIYPEPLEHEESFYEKVNKDMAVIALSDINERMEYGVTDADAPQLSMSEEQANYILGRRNSGESYPEKYINREIWNVLKNCGFNEWINTRVLYMQTLEEVDFFDED